AFGCKDSLITDEWRQGVLDFHNKYRRRLAKGKLKAGSTSMPPGNDINELYWDCNIEYNAFLNNCNSSVGIPASFTEISAPVKLNVANCNINATTTNVLKQWWSEIKDANPADPKYTDAIKNFGIMAYNKVTGFACTYNKACSDKLICLYDQKPVKDDPLYATGNTCTKVDGCTKGTSSCVDFLCQQDKGYTPSQQALPQTMCSAGKNDDMTYEMQRTTVNMINYYRRVLGTGWARDLNGYAPIAAGLVLMRYNCDALGVHAKSVIKDCNEPPYNPGKGWMLSHHKVMGTGLDPKKVLEEAITTWANQSAKIDFQKIAGGIYYEGEIEQKASDFAKMMFQSLSFVGCSVKECPTQAFTLVACEYNGLFTAKDPIYQVGKPCSRCPKGYKCDTALGGGICIKN
ncbi:SCP-like protein, partial [Ancylostoma caninum]